MTRIPNIVSIAGSDPSGGAGIQADLKTIAALGGYGMAVITALTAQNTRGVSGVHYVPAAFVAAQIQAIYDDIHIDAIKIGMAGDADTIYAIGNFLGTMSAKYNAPERTNVDAVLAHCDDSPIDLKQQNNANAPHAPNIALCKINTIHGDAKASRIMPIVVLDPVMVATSGDALSDNDSVKAMVKHLIPRADIITPNIPEAEILSGHTYNGDMKDLARAVIDAVGARAVYLKGGHADAHDGAMMRDVYIDDRGKNFAITHPRIDTKNTHGTGCTLSSAMATCLAQTPNAARRDTIIRAHKYLMRALSHANDLNVGRGAGPVWHGT